MPLGCFRLPGNVGNKRGMKFIQNAKTGLFFQWFQRRNRRVAPALSDKNPSLKKRLHEPAEATIGKCL